MPNLTINLIPTWLILAPLGPSWRQHRLQEASKWSSTGGPDRIWGHLGAKRAPKSSTPKNGCHFPAKCAPNIGFSQSKLAGGNSEPDLPDLPDPPETQPPGPEPTLGSPRRGQDYGSLHKPLKGPWINIPARLAKTGRDSKHRIQCWIYEGISKLVRY